MVVTVYNITKKIFYKIAGVDFNQNPKSTFILKEKNEEKSLSYIEYY